MYSVSAGDYCTGVSNDYGSEVRTFHIWGGNTIIEKVGAPTMNKGQESQHGCAVHCKGGSMGAEGIYLIDTLTEDNQPFSLYLGHQNVVSLQERTICKEHHH